MGSIETEYERRIPRNLNWSLLNLRSVPYLLFVAVGCVLIRGAAAQTASTEDAAIDQIRRLSNIAAIDRDTIRNWVQIQVDRLERESKGDGLNGDGFKAFRSRFNQQYTNTTNTSEFRAQFAAQTAAVAEAAFAKPDLNPTVGWALAHVLVDMPRERETIPGLVAGLTASVPVARYLCADGLTAQHAAIASDANRVAAVIQKLRDAAVGETSAAVLGRMYEALAFPGQQAATLEAYLAIFDSRLDRMRSSPGAVDGAEISAFELLRADRFLAALDANQKAGLVRRIAVFMRMDAQRYNDASLAPPSDPSAADLTADEREIIERRLDAEEEILVKIVGDKGVKIRDAFADGGYELRAEVLRRARAWVGDAEANQSGALNEAPWNVPVGAP